MSAQTLEVFSGTAHLGTLSWEPLEERFSFAYTDDWQRATGAFPLSPAVPLHGAAASSGTIQRFLGNLLPEGRALDLVAATHKVSKNNLYALVRELGRETTGALSFLPSGVTPGTTPAALREITHEELTQRLNERDQLPISIWEGRMRMSIAGFQDKLPVFMRDGRMHLADGAMASTHILKPEPSDPRVRMLVANEHFCLALARRLGLPAAEASILRLPVPVLIVTRFDREALPDSVRRLHILDGCQALDLPASYKYEHNFGSGRDVRHIRDGVSFPKLFGVAAQTLVPAQTQLMLLRWALLQYLIGNADAHGKNVSFHCGPQGLQLAPFYDLVSTVQYDGLDQELAMGIGDEFTLDALRPYDWALFAESTRIPRSLLAREMQRLARAAISAARVQGTDTVYLESEREVIDRIRQTVEVQAGKLIEMVGSVRNVELN